MPPPEVVTMYTQEKMRIFEAAGAVSSPSEYSESSASATSPPSSAMSPLAYVRPAAYPSNFESMSIRSVPSTTSTATAPNANLLAGALLSEVKDGQRKAEIIDPLLEKIYRIGLRSEKETQKLITAGVIPTLIILLRTRAVDGIGLGKLLVALGILMYVQSFSRG
ncbi:hypothetical protein C8F01DRAFT_1148089, partial [Mycena amicta]